MDVLRIEGQHKWLSRVSRFIVVMVKFVVAARARNRFEISAGFV